MSGPWFGGGHRRGAADLEPARSALDGAAQALLDLDTRQGFVEQALRTAREFAGPMDTSLSRLEQDWRPIAEQCFQASAEYLDVTAKFPLTDSMGRDNTALDVDTARRAFVGAHRAMADAATAVDRFYRAHQGQIDSAAHAAAAVPGQVAAARTAANTATEHAVALAGTDPKLLELRSVATPMDALTQALATLQAAGNPRQQQQAAAAVSEAAQALESAVIAAPQLLAHARSAVPSVRTRIDGVQTQLERLPESMSALWREFNQASSADLSQHQRRAQDLMTQAREKLAAGERAIAADDPETAEEAIRTARELAGQVDGLTDDVLDRLRLLREVKADPRQAESRVRFAVRDAQRLVVDRGLTAEWGSVLDAQSARIDRAVEAMQGAHPDYWALLRELDAVREFVGGVVDRVRQSARNLDAHR